MVEKYNVWFDCDISNIPDKVLKKVSLGFWTEERKAIKKKIEKNGLTMKIIVKSIYNSKNEYWPEAEIKIDKNK